MRADAVRITDTLTIALDRARELTSGLALVGYGVVTVHDEHGRLTQCQPFANLITDAGDLYYAGKAIAAIAPANPAAPTAASGMKLGTGVTAAAKSGAGGALITYLAASNVVFDATFPSTANLGAGLGVNAVYKTTWIAGVATNAALTEAVIVNDAATNATTTAANTYSRVVFTANHKFLGA